MIRIEVKHYPVWKLPKDLQGDFDPESFVTVVIESENDTWGEYSSSVQKEKQELS
jgi:hypothetical protein